MTYGGGIGLQLQRFSTRTTLSADYRYLGSVPRDGVGDFSRQSVGGGIDAHRWGRGWSATAGYRFTEARYEHRLGRSSNHLIDAGVDYRRRLSFSRRTTLSFGTGMSATIRNDTATRHAISIRRATSRSITRSVGPGTPPPRILAACSWMKVCRSRCSFDPRPSRLAACSVAVCSFGRRQTPDGTAIQLCNNAGELDRRLLRWLRRSSLTLSRHSLSLSANYSHYWHHFDDAVLLARGFPDAATGTACEAI